VISFVSLSLFGSEEQIPLTSPHASLSFLTDDVPVLRRPVLTDLLANVSSSSDSVWHERERKNDGSSSSFLTIAPRLFSACTFYEGGTAVRSDLSLTFPLVRLELTRTKELFTVQVGPVTKVSLSYGKDGRSTGVATVQFQQKGHAKLAYDRYDNKLIDNKKRMKVYPPIELH
jgi:RNA recognition motif. (a.k.a. RRM, RBD, or RNP domain)